MRFMLPADSIFACRDIWEIPREKVVAYARALQYWAEQNNLPAGGEPHLLAKSVQELREEVKWYLSFTDKEVFWGVALPEKEEEEESPRASAATTVTKVPCIPEFPPENRALKFEGWWKVLHPSRPGVAAGDIPPPTRTPRPRAKLHQLSWMVPIKPSISSPRSPTPPHPLRPHKP